MSSRCWGIVACLVSLLLLPAGAGAQELEPGAYWPMPRALNIATVTNNLSAGDVTFEPSLPVEEARARINTTAFAFTRGFGLAGRSANASVIVPVVTGHVEGLYLGAPTQVDRFGLGDPRVKLGVNLYGARSMSAKELGSFRWRTLLGASLTVAMPLGQYDSARVINIGTNRWSLKPELGFARANGHWVVELMAGVWLFTDNTEFVGGRTREQDPVLATQAHLTYRFQRGMWLAADANFYTGGRTTIGGKTSIDLQKNSRIGATFSKVLAPRHSIRASVATGAYTTIGGDFTSVAVGYNYAWVR